MQLRSSIAVVVLQASSCSSHVPPSPGTPCAAGVALKHQKKKKKKNWSSLVAQCVEDPALSLCGLSHFVAQVHGPGP